MASEFSKLAGIGGGIISNILWIVAALVVVAGAFYITRWIQKTIRKQKAFTITADIVDMNGVLEFDMLAFVKSEATGLLEMNFQTRKTDSIPPIPKHLIRNKHVLLLNYAPGHYCVVDTAKTNANYAAGINKVELYNLGMKKYITAKTREFLNKQQEKQRKIEVWGPWITLGVAVLAAILLAGFLFYFGLERDAANVASRTQECINMGWMP
jgi:prepilin signal peptidase PulO-like enzyme (type II secretory pathway)